MKKSRYFLKDLLDIIANFTKTQEERELSTKMFLPNVVDQEIILRVLKQGENL